MKRILINETEKNEILNQHKNFKKILEEKKTNLDKGLMIEQRVQDPIFLDKFTMSQVISKCVTNPAVKAIRTTFKGKDGVEKPAIKVVSGPDNVKIYTNEPNTNFGGYNSYILNTTEDKILKGPMSWKCSKLYAEDDAQSAAAKKAEEDKKAAEQAGMTFRQKEFTDGLVAQGYVINPSEWEITSKRLEKQDIEKIPGLKDLFKNGLNVYFDPTKIQGSNIAAYKERAASMTPDVNTCKDFVETFWDDYKGGGEGNLQDTQFVDVRNKVKACANKYYPKWNGLEGGVLGIGSGQNHLNNIIDVLTGRKTDYKGTGIPSRTTGWLLTPPRTAR
jgi:hypothetical protein